ncbi:MAG: hypothetical protein IPJ03_15695 [Ignavibacteriales bacterium]|nr:hypothetical protein [Ignavibacteriales bacterium]
MTKILSFIILLTSLTFGQSDLLLLFADAADSVDSPTSILAVGNVAKITLSWTNAATYDSVKIYRGTSTDPTTLVYTLAGGTTSKVDSALTEETIYYYRVKGKIGGSLSSYSSNASDTVLAIMYAVDLDGSTEYMSKTTPVNLDLNGAGRITDTKNRDMNGAVDYATNGNHSVTDSVTADKHAGTYSMTITSSAAGDATTNYVSLASSKFTTLVSGEKYTLEAWMRATNASAVCTLAIGNQTKVSGTLSTVAGTFTKVVWNFQATANEVNQPIKIFYNQADVVYVDDVSLAQKYDIMISLWAKMSRDGGNDNMISNNPTNATYGYLLKKTTANKLSFTLGDGTTTTNNSPTTTYTTQTTFRHIVITTNIDSTRLYVDGIWKLSADASIIGVSPISVMFALGRLSYVDLQYFSGQIGETQITRFTDIATSNYTPLQIYNRSKAKFHFPNAYTGGTIVGHWKFSGATDGVMLQDYSASGNNLVGSGVTQAGDQVILIGGY